MVNGTSRHRQAPPDIGVPAHDLIVDGHLDLGPSALYGNRDLTLDVTELRDRERGLHGKGLGANTVSLPEMRRGHVALALATLLTRTGGSPASALPAQRTPAIAYGMAQGQLAYYRALVAQGELRLIGTREALQAHWAAWQAWVSDPSAGDGDRSGRVEGPPPGAVVCMEGADGILAPEQVDAWWRDGLRVVSLSHYGPGAYAHGTGSDGGLTPAGRPLLRAMRHRGLILDLTHLTERGFWEALEIWDGPVLASHANCRALVPGERQLSDAQVRAVIERDGVIGCALDAWMLVPGWVRGESTPEMVGLDAFADHLAHVCDIAGDTDHAAIGSDLDGGFGAEQTPRDVDTIADLRKLPRLLAQRGFGAEDVTRVMHGNWLRFLRRWLPRAA